MLDLSWVKDIVGLSLLGLVGFFLGWLRISTYRFQLYSEYEKVEENLRRYVSSFNSLEGMLSLPVTETWTENDRSAVVQGTTSELLRKSWFVMGYNDNPSNEFLSMLRKVENHGYGVYREWVTFGVVVDDNHTHMEVAEAENFDRLKIAAKDRADRMLGTCRDEKRKLEGCVKGNIRAFVTLCGKVPVGTNSIMRTVAKRASDPNEKLTWRGVEK